jgi:hypothetical protein
MYGSFVKHGNLNRYTAASPALLAVGLLHHHPAPAGETSLIALITVTFSRFRVLHPAGVFAGMRFVQCGAPRVRRRETIRRTFVHLTMQDGAKTKLSRSRVKAPKLLLDTLSAWRLESLYPGDEDYIFASDKLGGKQPRSGSQLVEDYLRPAAIRAGVITVNNEITYDRDGEVVKRFGFHVLGRHSIATFLMDEQENPAVVQAVMRPARMDMTLYYSHSQRRAKRAAQEKVLQHLVPAPTDVREPMQVPPTLQ